jgi:hypothetical protein
VEESETVDESGRDWKRTSGREWKRASRQEWREWKMSVCTRVKRVDESRSEKKERETE